MALWTAWQAGVRAVLIAIKCGPKAPCDRHAVPNNVCGSGEMATDSAQTIKNNGAPSGAVAATGAGATTGGASGERDRKSALRGMSYDDQVAALAPEGPPVQREAKGAVPAAAGGVAGAKPAPEEHSFKLPSYPIQEGNAGPIREKVELGGDATVSIEQGSGAAGVHALGADEEKGGEPGTKVTSGVNASEHGAGVGFEVEKELAERNAFGWEVSPSLKGGVKLGKNGLELGVGYSLKHKFGHGTDINLSPSFNIISWEPGEEPHLAEFKVNVGATLPFFHYTSKRGVTVTVGIKPALTGSMWLSPKEAGELIMKALGEGASATLAAAALPIASALGAAAGLLYGWGKAGTELDQFEVEAARAAFYGHTYTNVLLGKKHDAGTGGLAVSPAARVGFGVARAAAGAQAITDAAATLKSMAAERGLPLEALRRNLPSGDKIYASAWNAKWPGIKAAWLAAVGSDKHLAHVIEAFGTGPFSTYSH